ncbi:MAG: tRNA (N(6)-L-threonylcarbamoyladenosine(37)-C(2))-methylthiotransferase MtaB [Candidatus Atribacteria bacterium]|nr:tRNA (N(6)-L-threonylcarbamoyladenosine(37)-C(2))-methylthiotransferase MtaB [Candidatus Atribacteria bacterium]
MKIFLDTIGCRLNQAEIESLARQFRAAGHEIVASAAEADLAVVNTCSVTAEAASDSRAAIRRAKRLGAGDIVVTGCWATLEPDKAASLPGVTRIVPNLQKDSLAADLFGLPQEFFDLEPIARQPLPGLHQRTRAFIKVQDGCDNACTFCITRLARGASRSRPLDEIISDVDSALKGGAQEIVLTGVHLGSWGLDFQPARRIPDLVSALLAQTSAPRLRLSSLEPWDLEADFFSLWRDPRLCRHLHLPLQSGSASVLRRMARKTAPDSFAALVQLARAAIPEVAITTDIIVGFPGETDEEFAETLEFVKSMHFAGGHVFSYSARPGTPAARMKGQAHGELIKARSATLRTVLAESAEAYRRKFIGKTMPVLWEATSILTDEGWQIEGLTDNYLRVTAIAAEPRWNQIDHVYLTSGNAEGLNGKIIGKSD